MTKKQQAALQRIIDREASRIEWEKQNKKMDTGIERRAGVHPSWERHIVTDGMVAVIFQEKPEGMPEAERMDCGRLCAARLSATIGTSITFWL